MLNPEHQLYDEEVRPLPKPKVIVLLIIIGYVTFVGLYLLLWESHPDWQLILNRISWSSADFVSVAGVALALYSYFLLERYQRNADIAYLQKFILELKKSGVKPEDIGSLFAVVKNLDPEFKVKLEKAVKRIVNERVEGLSKLTVDELYEVLRSGRL